MKIIYDTANGILVDTSSALRIKENDNIIREIQRQSAKYVNKNLEKIIEINNSKYTEQCLVVNIKEQTFGIAVDSIEMISEQVGEVNHQAQVSKVAVGKVKLRDKEYEILNLTKLTNIMINEVIK